MVTLNAALQVLGSHKRLTRIAHCLLGALVMLSSMGEAVLVLVRAGLAFDSRIAQTVQGWLLVKTRSVLPGQKTSSNGWKVSVVWPKMAPHC